MHPFDIPFVDGGMFFSGIAYGNEVEGDDSCQKNPANRIVNYIQK